VENPLPRPIPVGITESPELSSEVPGARRALLPNSGQIDAQLCESGQTLLLLPTHYAFGCPIGGKVISRLSAYLMVIAALLIVGSFAGNLMPLP
jgi:hypothetical protein